MILTADGKKLATSSHKGTIIRVWDVRTSQNIYEFRRGVERAQITCLAFSSDDQWLSCSSDKGTTHIFFLDKSKDEATKNKKGSAKKKNGNSNSGGGSSTNGSSSSSSSISFLSSGSRLLMGSLISSASGTKSQPKSICQIRGVPHPLACAFIGDAPHLIAVAGWDNDGNGVLLISEFAAHQEARRVAYHVLVKNSSTADETEEERRRRRARGWVPGGGSGGGTPANMSEDDPSMHFGHLRISDEMAEEAHRFQTQTTDDDFCEVIVEPRNIQNRKEPVIEDKPLSSSQDQQQQSQSQTLVQNNEIEEIDFSANDDNSADNKDLVTANDSTDDNKDNDINNNSNSNEKNTSTTTKEVEIDASSEKDSTVEPLKEDDGGGGNDDDD